MGSEFGQVVSIMIHVMPTVRLGGATVSAPVVRDHAIALLQEKHHLGVPIIRTKRPAMAEDDGLAGTPVFEKDLGAVFCSYCIHMMPAFLFCCVPLGEIGPPFSAKATSLRLVRTTTRPLVGEMINPIKRSLLDRRQFVY